MEIKKLREELSLLLENVVERSEKYADVRQMPSLEINVILSKVSKMQENLILLKHLIDQQEKEVKSNQNKEVEKSVVIDSNDQPTEEAILQIEKENVALVDQQKQSSLPKLEDAFLLNDRYLYANELFNKDMGAFNELVKTIDTCSSLHEAQQCLAQTQEKRSWDQENEHVVSFTEIVNRKFL